jgi:hypothetical protein
MANPLDSEPELVPFAARDEKEWLQSETVSSADKERLLAELGRRLTVWRANLKPSREQLLQVTHEENRIHARLDGGNAQFWEALDADWRRKQKPVDWQFKEEWSPKAREWLDMERKVARVYNSEKEAGDEYVASQRPPFAAPSEAQVSRDRIIQMRMVGLRPDPEDVEKVLRDDLEYQRTFKEKVEKVEGEFRDIQPSQNSPDKKPPGVFEDVRPLGDSNSSEDEKARAVAYKINWGDSAESAEERALRKRKELVGREDALQRQREMEEVYKLRGASLWPGVDEQHARRMQAVFEKTGDPAVNPETFSGDLAASNQKTNRFWTEIKKHPGWYLVAFLLSGLPVGIGTIWPTLTHETVPEWLAEHGWPRLLTLVECWLGAVAVIAIVIIVRSYLTTRRVHDDAMADHYQTNAAPKLAGRVDCLEVEVSWDTEHFGIDQENKCLLKVTLTLRATLLNESSASTTISGFQLHVLWKGGHVLATELPVENYSVTRSIPRSDGEWGYEPVSRRLLPFRKDIEITKTNHQEGDLRFFARAIPSAPESTDERPIVRDDVIFRLEALDRKRGRHKIYEGTWNGLPECGSIVRTVY